MAAFSTALLITGAAVAAGGVAANVMGARAERKAQDRAENFAREQQAREEEVAKQTKQEEQLLSERQRDEAKQERLRLEAKTELTPDELEREKRTFDLERKRQTELERRAGASGEDLLRELGPNTRQLLDEVAARQGKTGEQLFREDGGRVADLLLEELSAPGPSAAFEPELDLALQKINQDANRRGVYGGLPEGGIRYENLGRASVDLAIKSAGERLAQRQALASNLINLKAGARNEGALVSSSAYQASGGARDEISALLQDLEAMSASRRDARNRQLLGISGQEDINRREAFNREGASIDTAGGRSITAAQNFGGSMQELAGQQYGAASRMREQGLDLIGLGGQVAMGGMGRPPTSASVPTGQVDLLSSMSKEREAEEELRRRRGMRGSFRTFRPNSSFGGYDYRLGE